MTEGQAPCHSSVTRCLSLCHTCPLVISGHTAWEGTSLIFPICQGSGSQGRKRIHPGGHDVMSAGASWRSGCERAGQFPGSHSREIVVRMSEQTVSSTRDASSDIARPEQTRALVPPREELSCPKDGSAEARPSPANFYIWRKATRAAFSGGAGGF